VRQDLESRYGICDELSAEFERDVNQRTGCLQAPTSAGLIGSCGCGHHTFDLGLNGHRSAPRGLVLGCHRVIADGPLKPGLDVSPQWLREVIKLPYKFRTLYESLEQKSEPTLVLTFDDGDPSVGANALPALAAQGIRATAFLIVEPGHPMPRFWSDLLAAGWEVGSHSLTHPALDFLDAHQSRTEIRDSKLRLEDLLHAPIRGFAFPYGRFGRREIDFVAEAGYEYAVTTLPWLPPRWRSHEIKMVARKMCEESTPMWKIRALADRRSLRIAGWLVDESLYRINAIRSEPSSPLRVLPTTERADPELKPGEDS